MEKRLIGWGNTGKRSGANDADAEATTTTRPDLTLRRHTAHHQLMQIAWQWERGKGENSQEIETRGRNGTQMNLNPSTWHSLLEGETTCVYRRSWCMFISSVEPQRRIKWVYSCHFSLLSPGPWTSTVVTKSGRTLSCRHPSLSSADCYWPQF